MPENSLNELAVEYIRLRDCLASKEMEYMSKMRILTGDKKKKSEILTLLNKQNSEIDVQIEKLKRDELTLDMNLREFEHSCGAD